MRAILPLAAAALFAPSFAACHPPPDPEPAPNVDNLDRTSSAIIGGRLSGDDENAAVAIETTHESGEPLRCSGRIIAPGLVITARHCLIKRATTNVQCKPDGTPVNIDEGDQTPEPNERITVFVGSARATRRPVTVRDVIIDRDVSICRGDLAFVALSESGFETRTPLRRAPVAPGDKISITGWGYRSNADRVAGTLPDDRWTLDAVPITEVGPGRTPAGTFWVGGKTLCLGDSGSIALVDGAVVGTYSRINDEALNCELDLVTNTITAIAPHVDLVKRAYEKIGEEPWYAGEQKPWLAPAGAACASDDDCRSARCEAAQCVVACGASGLACPSGQVCAADGATCTAAAAPPTEPPPAAAESSSCASAPAGTTSAAAGSTLLAALVLMVTLYRRRRATAA